MLQGGDPEAELKGERQFKRSWPRPRTAERGDGAGRDERRCPRRRCGDAGAAGLGRFALAGRRATLFVAPALGVMGAVIVFPWLFTLFMSVHDWRIGQAGHSFVGVEIPEALRDERLPGWCHPRYTSLPSRCPGLRRRLAMVFHRHPVARCCAGISSCDDGDSVAVGLVLTMMFHPSSAFSIISSASSASRPPLVFDQATVILARPGDSGNDAAVMLIVLGASRRCDRALRNRRSSTVDVGRCSAYHLPMVLPSFMVAAIIRTIDA